MTRWARVIRPLLGCALLLLAGGRGWVSQAEGASGDADGTYSVTVTRVEISADGGTTFTTIFSGSQLINIAAANAGAVAAGLASGAQIAPGTYNRVRTTIGASLLIRGYVNSGATTYYTNNDSDGFGLNTSGADTTGTDYATSTFTIPADNRTSTQTVSITVPVSGASPTVRISFDTTGTITLSGGLPTIGAPSITITSI